MIKLKQIKTHHGVTYLLFEYDKGEEVLSTEIAERDVVERLKQLRGLVSRKVTLQDLKDVIVAMVGEVRRGKMTLPERFDYSNFIDVDLEA